MCYLCCHLQVRHSQRFSETPLSCWIIIELTGEICCAHCNCMASLGQACTHIASILFYLEACTRLYGTSTTCIQEACQWIIPTYLKEVEYLPFKDIDFISARGQKRKLNGQIKEALSSDTHLDNEIVADPEGYVRVGIRSTEPELSLFFTNLSIGDTKPGVLSIIPNYP